jgi:hypothetical protein
MIWVIRLSVLLIELVGLVYALKLIHEGQFRSGLLLFAIETVVLIVFVLTHCLIEMILDRHKRKHRSRWWV